MIERERERERVSSGKKRSLPEVDGDRIGVNIVNILLLEMCC